MNKFGVKDNGLWFDVLHDLTETQLEHGLTKIKRLETNGRFDEFPPNALQFRKLCIEFRSDNNLKSAGAAFDEALTNVGSKNPRWSHPLVQFCANKVGASMLRDTPIHIAFPRFKALYDKACELFRAGNDVPFVTPLPMIANPSSLDKSRNYLSELKKFVGSK